MVDLLVHELFPFLHILSVTLVFQHALMFFYKAENGKTRYILSHFSAHVRYCDHMLSVCPSVVVNFSHFTSPLKPLNWIQWNLTGSKISTSSTKFEFFRPIWKTRWPSPLLIGWVIFRLLLWNCWIEFNKTNTKQHLNVSTKFVFFVLFGENKMAGLASDWPRHFQLLLWNRWMDFNETWQEARY